MKKRPRFYTAVLTDHLEKHRQMALVSGPRQVGKTTACKSLSDQYLNWDNADDRRRVLRSPAALAAPRKYHRGRSRFAIEAGPAQLYRARPAGRYRPAG